jgi:hypothetical protein
VDRVRRVVIADRVSRVSRAPEQGQQGEKPQGKQGEQGEQSEEVSRINKVSVMKKKIIAGRRSSMPRMSRNGISSRVRRISRRAK